MNAEINNDQKLIFESENGNKLIFTYKNKEKLIKDLEEYFPYLFPQLQPTIKKMLTRLTN